MEMFEKVEKLTQKANVSYEEAKAALEACGGDLLDAMIYLEKAGKTEAPKSETVTTRAQDNCLPCTIETESKKEEKKASNNDWKEDFKKAIRTFWSKIRDNDFVIKKDNEVKFKLPIFVSLIIFILAIHIAIPAMIISLFFGVRYGFAGDEDLEKANETMDKVGAVAESVTAKVKEEFSKNKEN